MFFFSQVPAMNNMSMNTIPAPNFSLPVLQSGGNLRYTNMPNQNLCQTSPVTGFYTIPYTPQDQPLQPICNSTINQRANNEKIDNLTNIVDQMFSKLSVLNSLTDKIKKVQSTMDTLIHNVDSVTKRVSEVEKKVYIS